MGSAGNMYIFISHHSVKIRIEVSRRKQEKKRGQRICLLEKCTDEKINIQSQPF